MLELVNPLLLWFVLGLGFLLFELFFPAFVLLFFGFGAWVAGLFAFMNFLSSFAGQIVVFLAASLALLFVARPRLRKWRQTRSLRNLNTLVGSFGVALTDIEPGSFLGKVEVHGTPWNAEAFEAIPRGARVTVVAQDNLTLTVEPLPTPIWG